MCPHRLSECGLSETHCEVVASALKSNPSHLRHLDLSWNNNLQDPAVQQLCGGLQNVESTTKAPVNVELSSSLSPSSLSSTSVSHWISFFDSLFRLWSCRLSETGCGYLVSALKSNPSHLRHLDLGDNDLYDPGVQQLCGGLQSPDCRLETLRLIGCRLSETSCGYLASALKSNPSHLRHLDLGYKRDLQDRGVQQLCGGLQKNRKLVFAYLFRLRSCSLSETSCGYLVSALKSNPSYLRELDLSHNNLQDPGVQQLCDLVQSPHCRLETLRSVEGWSQSMVQACCDHSNPSHLTELDLCWNNLQDPGVLKLCGGLQSPHCRLETLRSLVVPFIVFIVLLFSADQE
uniref:NACHT LRR and PYD domain-containing protein n=1 Tax=Mastacembelus armatus TaxID=205130 RepID=A0A3Q3S9T4_9TELE